MEKVQSPVDPLGVEALRDLLDPELGEEAKEQAREYLAALRKQRERHLPAE